MFHSWTLQTCFKNLVVATGHVKLSQKSWKKNIFIWWELDSTTTIFKFPLIIVVEYVSLYFYFKQKSLFLRIYNVSIILFPKVDYNLLYFALFVGPCFWHWCSYDKWTQKCTHGLQVVFCNCLVRSYTPKF